jgi:phage regulator Rha-like protein
MGSSIFVIRGQKVMIDESLARLYGVETKVFNQAVKRNIDRFPEDFMFRLTREESDSLRFQFETLNEDVLRSQNVTLNEDVLRSQNATLKQGRGQHRKYLPYVFTEQGVAMLSSVLNSKRAIQVNILIMRTFAKLKEMISAHKELAYKMRELERKVGRHDEEISVIIDVMKKLMHEPDQPKKGIGFHVK